MSFFDLFKDQAAKDLQAQIERDLMGANSAGAAQGQQLGTSSGTVLNNSFFNHSSVGYSLSKEEQEELAKLEEQRKVDIKKAKIEAFKKLPASLRQKVVDEIILDRSQVEISTLEIPHSDRHKELINKRSSGFDPNLMLGGLRIDSVGGYSIKVSRTFNIEGLDDDDLIAAHNDAAMEENLLGK